VQISEQVVVVPVRGQIDAYRVQHLQQVLERLVQTAALTTVILDLTGVPLVPLRLAETLVRIHTVCTARDVALMLAGLGADAQHELQMYDLNVANSGMFVSLPAALAAVSESLLPAVS
jgi:anti-anti-sigma factor